ncbi:isocitrate lyase/phosphoenolpyruvate mutase family protein [Micromonospora sp. GCM10011542]|uniref:Mu transposase domain-containing protein n=1 Tax=Micromonospora sp. GCM10011542 TaxID=3317337 RepID=UPI0036127FF8
MATPSAGIAASLGYRDGSTPPDEMFAALARIVPAVPVPVPASADIEGGLHWTLISSWGRVPKALVWDNESAVGQWRAGRPQLTEAMNAFRGSLGIKVIQCRPADPEAKGPVERANGYLETSFLPGRRFSSPADFNAQLSDWLVRANSRQHRMLRCRPLDRWDADRAAMLPLPPVAPVVGWRQTTWLPRDHYVRLDGNDYSVHPSVVGRRVEVTADCNQVQVLCDGRPVARHDRCWASHQSITDPAHRQAAVDLRIAAQRTPTTAVDAQVQRRLLSDYDRMFGLDEVAA